MRIVTWNCNGALRKKIDILETIQADIIVVQECEDPTGSKDKHYREWASNFFWTGGNQNKGLGIFAKDNLKLEKLDWENDGLKHFIPCRVNDEFNFLGAWCHGANSPTFGYIGQLWKYLQIHKTKLNKSIIAGDFNSNIIWDKRDRWWNHSDVVRELKELKIESLYHNYLKEEQGKETQPTFFLHRNRKKNYHIDYIFASEDFLKQIKNVTIGEVDKWIEFSDHMPVICELKIEKISNASNT